MSFPKHPIHIVFLRSMNDVELNNIISPHCEEFDPSVRNMCMSLAKLIRDNEGGYTINKYGVKRARATTSLPQITVECIDMSSSLEETMKSTENVQPFEIPNPFKELGESKEARKKSDEAFNNRSVFPLEIPNPFKKNQNMKVVYYKDGKMHIEVTHFTNYDKFKDYHTRIYPADYEPEDGSYGFEKLIDCW